MVLDASMLNTQHYKVCIKGKQSNPGKVLVPSSTPIVEGIEKGAFGSSLTTVGQHIYIYTHTHTHTRFHQNICREKSFILKQLLFDTVPK